MIALHDIEIADALGPPLTTVRMPHTELGRRAGELLLETPRDDPIGDIITGPMGVIERGSTSAPAMKSRHDGDGHRGASA